MSFLCILTDGKMQLKTEKAHIACRRTSLAGAHRLQAHIACRKWAADTYKWYKEILRTDSAPKLGICHISGYLLSDKDTLEVGSWSKVLDNLVKLSKEQLASFGEEIRSGYFLTSVICESSKYLPWLLER
eukprot:gene15648-6932_t